MNARINWRRDATLLLALTWLGIGLFGAYLYTHRYQLYRGFPPPVTPAGVARGSVHEEHFTSAALGGSHRYLIYLPPHYSARAARGARFPVLYLLHGTPGSPEVFTQPGALAVQADVLLAQHKIKPTIFVMPSGQGGLLQTGSEWANAQAGPYENYVLDVMHAVDRRFATVRNRQGRGIAGLSEGAFGALNITLHHLADFSVAESWSGYFNEQRSGAFSHATAAAIRSNSPAQYVTTLSPQIHRLGYRAWIYQGELDSNPPIHIQSFSAALHTAGAEVHYGFFPGGHDWGLWRAQLPRMIIAASGWFNRSPRSGALGFSSTGHAGSAAAIRQYHIKRRKLCLRRRAARRAAGKPPGHPCEVIPPLPGGPAPTGP
jgi:enterochelin esterase-like enzyme